MKPLYTLNSIELLVRYGLNYAMGSKQFTIECRAEEGFKISFNSTDGDYFQVINTNDFVKVYIRPAQNVQTEFSFDEIDNNIYAFKDSFDTWIRCLYEKQKRQACLHLLYMCRSNGC